MVLYWIPWKFTHMPTCRSLHTSIPLRSLRACSFLWLFTSSSALRHLKFLILVYASLLRKLIANHQRGILLFHTVELQWCLSQGLHFGAFLLHLCGPRDLKRPNIYHFWIKVDKKMCLSSTKLKGEKVSKSLKWPWNSGALNSEMTTRKKAFFLPAWT